MKIVMRVLAVAIAFSVLAGGAQLVAADRAPSRPAAGADPIVVPPASESPRPAPPPATQPPVDKTPVVPTPERPRRAAGKIIEVSIERQELIAREDGKVVYRFRISTGKAGYETPKGTFRIHTKYDNRWSRKWKVWMPYAMFWHPKWGYAFHELPYYPGSPHKRMGASKLGRADSHGCVRVNLGDAKKLYEWAPVGTAVRIY